MTEAGRSRGLFDFDTWSPALEKFGAVSQLTVRLYVGERVVCGPLHATPLFKLLARYGYEPGIFAECAARCLAEPRDRPAVVVAPHYGLAVVGTSLVLEGEIVGAAVAGYALIDFCRSSAIEQLAREAGAPFQELWEIARAHQPVPERRLLMQGELLQVLGDAILREHHRTSQYESTSAMLAQELAAKDDFLAMLSHELRTPLTPIRAWARMLQTGGSPERTRHAAEVIERNAVLQTRLVDDLLELNRARLGKMTLDLKIHDLRELLHSALEAVVGDAQGKGIAVEVAESGEPLLSEVDGDRTQQIFRNVLSNAVKFTPTGGRIWVQIVKEADGAAIRIRDSGAGVTPEFLPFAFEPFRQQEQGTRREYSGLGIGLALVKHLTELHGGRVTLASAGKGLGTEVTVRLPLVSWSGDAWSPPASDPIRDLTGLRLLLVDDAEDTRDAMRMLLEELGADVQLARDGVEALDVVRNRQFDIVFCDLQMPRLDGFGFIQAVRQAPSDLPPRIIAMSGFASSADHEQTSAAGFDGHVDKPPDLHSLIATIEAAMARPRPTPSAPRST